MTQIMERVHVALADHRARQDGRDRSVVSFPRDGTNDLLRALAAGTERTCRLVVPFLPQKWDPNAFEHALWRQVATRGRHVFRLYLLPHRGLGALELEEQLRLDVAAGIDSAAIAISDIPKEVMDRAARGFSLFDDEVALIDGPLAADESDASSRTVTARVADVDPYVTAWHVMWGAASATAPADPEHSHDLEEPLVMSADLVHGVAAVLCEGDHVDAEGCDWYHGAWQYLRLMDLVSTPTWHGSFYSEALAAELKRSDARPTRVLITGTADYSVYSYVVAAAERANHPVEVTVLDRCPTPLFACRWYAKQRGRQVETLTVDLLDHSVLGGRKFDVITTDAFLTRFPATTRSEVLERWHCLLDDGGSVVTTVRIHEANPVGRTEEEAVADFCERATVRFRRWATFSDRTSAEIEALAFNYARQMVSHPTGTEMAVRTVWEDSGLPWKLERWTRSPVPGELYPTSYVQLVARKGL